MGGEVRMPRVEVGRFRCQTLSCRIGFLIKLNQARLAVRDDMNRCDIIILSDDLCHLLPRVG